MRSHDKRARMLLILGLVLVLAADPGMTTSGHTIPPTAIPPFSCALVTEIPQSECHALVALYNSTNGPDWGRYGPLGGWLITATPCRWYGVACEDSHVSELTLVRENLTGPIPPELGNLTNLRVLSLWDNFLSGPIPPELGNLTNLQVLSLDFNHLSGAIPPELGNLVNLRELILGANQLKGTIPPQLANLHALTDLSLSHNALTATEPALLDFLAEKSQGWDATQTVAPSSVQARVAASDHIIVTWTPIRYTSDGGYYEISYATDPAGPFTVHGRTRNKSHSQYTLTGLTPDPNYFVRVRTYTPAIFPNNQNEQWSDYSNVVFVATTTVYLPLIAQ
jgi:Leucine-rich repeat (LRR) protein